MNRKEAIEVLTKTAEELKFLITDGLLSRSTKVQYIDLIDAVERLSEPLTLVDLLGWEEGVEYEYRPAQNNEVTERAKIVDNIFYVFISSIADFVKCPIYSEDIPNMKQATKLETKLKAYHVKDEYSYNELMKELEEQGYIWSSNQKPTEGFNWDVYKDDTVIYCDENNWLSFSDLYYFESQQFDRRHINSYDLIEYHKEEPLYYAKIKGWELTKGSDCYWHEDGDTAHVIYPWSRYKASIYTKTEWDELGINDTNADFEEIDEN